VFAVRRAVLCVADLPPAYPSQMVLIRPSPRISVAYGADLSKTIGEWCTRRIWFIVTATSAVAE